MVGERVWRVKIYLDGGVGAHCPELSYANTWSEFSEEVCCKCRQVVNVVNQRRFVESFVVLTQAYSMLGYKRAGRVAFYDGEKIVGNRGDEIMGG